MRHVNTDRLVRDLGAVMADIDELTQAMGENASEAMVAARERIAGSLRTALRNVEDSRRQVMRQTRCVAKSTNGYLQDNVWKVMGIAGAVGILAGALLSHKSESPGEPRD